jgi:hypothetical protein
MKDYLLDRLTLYIQGLLWFIGIAIHNHYRNECTKDFNCCGTCGRKAFIKIKDITYNRQQKS